MAYIEKNISYSPSKYSPKYHFTEEEMESDSLYCLMEEGKLSEYIPRVTGGLYGSECWNTVEAYYNHMNDLTEAEKQKTMKKKKSIRFAVDVKENDGPAIPCQLVIELCNEYRNQTITDDKGIEFFLKEKQVDTNTLFSMYNIFYNALERLYKLRSDLYSEQLLGTGKKIKKNIPFIMNGGSDTKINIHFIPPFEYITETLYKLLL